MTSSGMRDSTTGMNAGSGPERGSPNGLPATAPKGATTGLNGQPSNNETLPKKSGTAMVPPVVQTTGFCASSPSSNWALVRTQNSAFSASRSHNEPSKSPAAPRVTANSFGEETMQKLWTSGYGLSEMFEAVRESSLKRLAPRAGSEPATIRLTVECSTAELPRNRRNKGSRAGSV